MDKQIATALAAFDRMIAEHVPHKWKQVGRCVYCDDCKTRLYQGRLPEDRRASLRAAPEPKATTEMRARWGKE
jgi:hypothetical protein